MSLKRFNLAKCSILVADSDRVSLSILTQLLLGLGATAMVKCETLQEAKEELLKQDFHLFLLDPSSFGEEGHSFIQWLRRDLPDPNKHLQAIYVTGHTSFRFVEQSRDSGVSMVLKKPLSPGAVVSRIDWLGKSPRPFVKSNGYNGPDRRFKNVGPPEDADERRKDEIDTFERLSQRMDLGQAEIDALMDKRVRT